MTVKSVFAESTFSRILESSTPKNTAKMMIWSMSPLDMALKGFSGIQLMIVSSRFVPAGAALVASAALSSAERSSPRPGLKIRQDAAPIRAQMTEPITT